MTTPSNMSHHGTTSNGANVKVNVVGTCTGQKTDLSSQSQAGLNVGVNVNLSAAAISTAAAVAAISGSFHTHPPLASTSTSTHTTATNATRSLLPSNLYHPSLIAAAVTRSSPSTPATTSATSNSCTSSHNTTSHNKQLQTPFTIPQHANFHAHPMQQSQHQQQQPYSFRQPPGQVDTSHIFSKMPLRRGKWNPEEERYANAIIEEFEKGTIKGCENGCTLRAYLSRKLHCQPMRISKKYAGKSIGKQVFLSRLNVASGSGSGSGGQKDTSAESLKHFEFQFHLSAFQEGMTNVDGSLHASTLLSVTALQNYANTNGIGASSSGAGTGRAISNRSTGQANATGWQQPATMSTAVPNPVPNAVQYPSLPQVVPSVTCQLQQNLFNAFREAQNQNAYTNETKRNDKKGQSENYSAKMGTSSQSCFSAPAPVPTPVLDPRSTNTTVLSATNTLALPVQSPNISSSAAATSSSTTAQSEHETCAQAQQNWINEAMAIIPTLDPTIEPTNYNGRFSPTYTSKSFDDLHQFIGNDCIPSNTQEVTQSNKETTGIGPATEVANRMGITIDLCSPRRSVTATAMLAPPSFTASHESRGGQQDRLAAQQQMKFFATSTSTTNGNQSTNVFHNAADEYAFCAQQSVLAASKHSAYCGQDLARTSLKIPKKNVHASLKLAQVKTSRCDTPIVSQLHTRQQTNETILPNTAAFNRTNLQIHSKAAAAAAVVAQVKAEENKCCTESSHPTGDTFAFNAVTNAGLTRTSNPPNNHSAPIVSGSERSSEMGTEGSAVGSGNGSYGAASSDFDQSDSASESTGSSLRSKGCKRKINVNNGDDHRKKKIMKADNKLHQQ